MHSELIQSELPELHLDGPILRRSFDSLVVAADKYDGIESLIDALAMKSTLFTRTFATPEYLLLSEFLDACAFIPTVRRRVNVALETWGFEHIKDSINVLLSDLQISNTDEHISMMCGQFPKAKEFRWVRDLAAEIIHFRDPTTFPLMTRWIWDQTANSGVLREIWYEEFRDTRLNISDSIRTHLTLRTELSDFLNDSSVYANLPFTIDLLYAWVYGEYIGAQGGSFLKTDFTQGNSPIGYCLRMLGLDGISAKDGKTRLIMPDGKRYVLSNIVDSTTH